MKIKNELVILRDFIESDVKDRERWETVDNEWQQWDGPWIPRSFDIDEYKKNKMEYLAEIKKNSDIMRSTFEVCINNEDETHIGWVNSYYLDKNFKYTKDGGMTAIGIDIPETDIRHKGYGTAAFKLFVEYLNSKGINDIYTETWSGNKRMIHTAEKLGFKICRVNKEACPVNGKIYDGYTFKLSR